MAIRMHFSKSSKLSRPNFLLLDEGFTSLDKNRLKQTRNIFEYLKTRYQFILVITHLEQLESYFDQKLEITLDPPYSHIMA